MAPEGGVTAAVMDGAFRTRGVTGDAGYYVVDIEQVFV